MSEGSSAKYHQNHKERLQKTLSKDIKVVLKKTKNKKQQYGCERYKNLPQDEKQNLVEYSKQYYKIRKKRLVIIIRNYSFKK